MEPRCRRTFSARFRELIGLGGADAQDDVDDDRLALDLVADAADGGLGRRGVKPGALVGS